MLQNVKQAVLVSSDQQPSHLVADPSVNCESRAGSVSSGWAGDCRLWLNTLESACESAEEALHEKAEIPIWIRTEGGVVKEEAEEIVQWQWAGHIAAFSIFGLSFLYKRVKFSCTFQYTDLKYIVH